jgi:citrate lyase subunit beta/citryl-CoA lyase
MVDVRVGQDRAPHRQVEGVHGSRERLPLRAHHEGVDHGDAVVVDDHPRVGDAGLAPRQQPRVHAVGQLGEGDLVGHAPRLCPPVPPLPGLRSTLARMSERSRNLPRRTCLAVPGSSEKMLGKAPGLGADMVFLDLEDSVAPLETEAARDNVVRAIRELDWGDTVVCVRVNAWDTKWTYRDVIHVVENAGERLDEIMLPKVQYASDVVALDLLLTQIEETIGRETHVGIEAQIETARGLINVEEICAASPRMETIVFGPADFAASTEMPVLTGGVQIPEYPGDHFHYTFSKILMAGRANGLQVIDGPFLKIKEVDALRDYAMRTRILGYDGKWALHPDQVAVINEVFTPTQEQYDHAFDILDAYEKATTEGDRRGAVMFGDEMIDEASRKMALKFVSRGERAGMQRSA